MATPKSHGGALHKFHQFLTAETFRLSIRLYRIAAFIHCIPFELESGSSLRVKMFSSKLRILLWHLANWIYFFQAVFLVVTFAIAVTTEPFGEMLVIHLIYVVGVLFGLVFMLTCYLKPHACVVMLNQHDFMLRKVEGDEVNF